jgi:predicted adenylyl cyclase CyaB
VPANVEIKARVADFARLRSLAETLSDTAEQVIEQEDTFFAAPTGRLKLRTLAPNRGELIAYERADVAGPKRSDYCIYRTGDPAGLKATLSHALGVLGVVRKTRHLFLVGQTRIHLDDVEGLGHYLELEVVLRPDQSTAGGMEITEALMRQLGIMPSDLVEGAYFDRLTPPRP